MKFDKRDILRGFTTLVPILLLVLLLILLAEPRERHFAASNDFLTKAATNGVAADGGAADSLFEFDPNTATFRELRALGLSQVSAAAVARRQQSGFAFSVKEDLAAIYGVDDSLYYRLEPYIVIADKYRQKPYPRREYAERPRRQRTIRYEPFRIDTASAAYLATLGFSERQARVVVNYRDRRGGIYSLDELAECYVVDAEMCDTLARYIIFPEPEEVETQRLVDINTADSAALRRVRGIGEKTVVRILEWRERLGGFYSIEQLAADKLVSESNFEQILSQICCDSCNISKIDINFASPAQLKGHPYIAPQKLRRLLSKRQLKGGWSKIEEMVDDDIFTEQEAERLRPYLRFTRKAD